MTKYKGKILVRMYRMAFGNGSATHLLDKVT